MAAVIIKIISYLSMLLCPVVAVFGLSLPIFLILISVCVIVLNYRSIRLNNYILWCFPIVILAFSFLAPTSVLPFELAFRILAIYFLGVGLITFGSFQQSSTQKFLSYLSYGYLVAIFLLLLMQIMPVDILSYWGQKLYKSDFRADHYLILKINRQLCAFSLLHVMVTLFFYKINRKYFAIITYFLTLITIFISQSETAKLVFIITNVVFILVYFGNSKFRYALISFYFIGNMVAITIIPTFNVQKIAENTNLQHSALHRLCIWQYTIGLIKEKPLGYGFNSSINADFVDIDDKEICVIKNEKTIRVMEEIKYHISWHPHYNILQILLELGIVGLCLLGIILFKIEYFLQKRLVKKLPIAIIYSMIFGYLAIGTTGYDIWQSWYFSIFFLLTFYIMMLINPKLDDYRNIPK